MPRILLVDDDDFYRGALKTSLLRSGHEVIEATDGAGAKHILGLQSFDLVISDIRMPGLSGVALLEWIRTSLAIPVILITGFSEIMEAQQAAVLGAQDFLLKPFNSSDIEAAIAKAIQPSGAANQPDEDLDPHFRKVPLEDFVSGSRINFSIYLRISNSKYVKIAYRGEDIDVERVRSYKAKGLKNLFLTKEDFAKYVNFSLDLMKKVSASQQISEEKKRNFLRYSGEVVMEQIFVTGGDPEIYESAKEFATSTLDLITKNDAIYALLDSLNSHADFLYAHSLGVSLYGTMIAKAMHWNSTQTLFKVSFAGLMHDIGLKEIPREILDKPRMAMSQEERGIYETHPNRGMELLNQIGNVSGDTILISYQHHEESTGFGYPQKLSGPKIHPLARLISVADQFCYFTIKNPTHEKMTAPRAIHQMEQTGKKTLDAESFSALKKVFGFA